MPALGRGNDITRKKCLRSFKYNLITIFLRKRFFCMGLLRRRKLPPNFEVPAKNEAGRIGRMRRDFRNRVPESGKPAEPGIEETLAAMEEEAKKRPMSGKKVL